MSALLWQQGCKVETAPVYQTGWGQRSDTKKFKFNVKFLTMMKSADMEVKAVNGLIDCFKTVVYFTAD